MKNNVAPPAEGFSLSLFSVENGPAEAGVDVVRLHTDDGVIDTRYHPAAPGAAAVLWVFGAGGGLDGPAGGLYARLAEQLAPAGIASLRLDYRRPAELVPSVLDVLMGVAWLRRHDRPRIVLVGHAFGGAVAISAGVIDPDVVGVAALSSQTYGTDEVARLSPRPLLLVHGTADEVLPDSCSLDIYRRARDPRKLLRYPDARHGLDECRADLDRDLLAWIRDVAN